MRYLGLIIGLVSAALAATTARAEYEQVWAEEFDGDTLDASSWTADHCYGVVRSARDIGFYTKRPENVRIADGALQLVARKEAFEIARFTSARVQTHGKKAFTYGRFAIRLKAPSTPGLRLTVQLLPEELTYGSWPASGGIDILEVGGGAVSSGLYFGGSGPRGAHVPNDLPRLRRTLPDEEFHIYAIEWQPYEVRWFMDGRLVAKQNRWSSSAADYPAPFDKPFHLAIGWAVENPEAEQIESWPQTVSIDWIQVGQAKGNRAPLVKLTEPAEGAKLPGGQPVTITANASDEDGNLRGVIFYNGETRLSVIREEPFTFAWNAPDGCHNLIVRAVDADGFACADSAEITVGKGCPPTPYHGMPAAIPGRIEAEDFDASKKGEAYFDVDPSNNGGAYRPDSGVDIQPCRDGGFNLCWMIDNEWTQYTVAVAKAGLYDLRARVASPNDTARIHLEFNGQNKTGSMVIPLTGDWQNYTDVVVRGIELSAGEQVMRMVVEKEGLNLDYLELVPAADE